MSKNVLEFPSRIVASSAEKQRKADLKAASRRRFSVSCLFDVACIAATEDANFAATDAALGIVRDMLHERVDETRLPKLELELCLPYLPPEKYATVEGRTDEAAKDWLRRKTQSFLTLLGVVERPRAILIESPSDILRYLNEQSG